MLVERPKNKPRGLDTHGDSERKIKYYWTLQRTSKKKRLRHGVTIKPYIESSEMSSKYCSMYLHKINVNSYHILQLYIVSIFVVYGL